MNTQITLVINNMLTEAAKQKASDIHLLRGSKPVLRIDHKLVEMGAADILTEEFLQDFLKVVLNEKEQADLQEKKVVKTVYVLEGKVRFRVSAHFQKGGLSVGLKLINPRVHSLDDLNLGSNFKKLASFNEGLIVLSGPYNSGKSTILAAVIEEINRTKNKNIVTIEDPVEYIFINDKSIIEQRQVGRDVNSFLEGIEQCRDEDVDVVVVTGSDGPHIIQPIVDMASSGRLVFFVTDSVSVIHTLERILAAFPAAQQQRAREMLAETLVSICSFRLLSRSTGSGGALAYGMLFSNASVQSLLRDGKIAQLITSMQTSQAEGMITLDQQLFMLVQQGVITPEVALEEAVDKNNLRAKLRG